MVVKRSSLVDLNKELTNNSEVTTFDHTNEDNFDPVIDRDLDRRDAEMQHNNPR